MAKFISMFNNKGGVGKTNLDWNIADALAGQGRRVLLVDFDPQCNLSIAMLGADAFKGFVSGGTNNKTIRAFLQGYLQNTGPGPVEVHIGPHTDPGVKLIAGDFWLNVYSDALSVGNDLLTGNGIAKFTALRTLEAELKKKGGCYSAHSMRATFITRRLRTALRSIRGRAEGGRTSRPRPPTSVTTGAAITSKRRPASLRPPESKKQRQRVSSTTSARLWTRGEVPGCVRPAEPSFHPSWW
jgi:AAA domain